MKYTIEAREGHLYVATDWVASEGRNGYEYRFFYPTGIEAAGYEDLIGRECVGYDVDAGLYRVIEDGRLVQMKDGGRTIPEAKYTEWRPVPRGRRARRAIRQAGG